MRYPSCRSHGPSTGTCRLAHVSCLYYSICLSLCLASSRGWSLSLFTYDDFVPVHPLVCGLVAVRDLGGQAVRVCTFRSACADLLF